MLAFSLDTDFFYVDIALNRPFLSRQCTFRPTAQHQTMAHHLVHHCCLCCLAGVTASNTNTVFVPISSQRQSSRQQAAIQLSAQTVPAEILALTTPNRKTFILLYIFADVNGRMPRPNENFCNIKLGQWLHTKVLQWHRKKMMSRAQLLALSRVPHYPLPINLSAPITAPPKSSAQPSAPKPQQDSEAGMQRASDRTPLLQGSSIMPYSCHAGSSLILQLRRQATRQQRSNHKLLSRAL